MKVNQRYVVEFNRFYLIFDCYGTLKTLNKANKVIERMEVIENILIN